MPRSTRSDTGETRRTIGEWVKIVGGILGILAVLGGAFVAYLALSFKAEAGEFQTRSDTSTQHAVLEGKIVSGDNAVRAKLKEDINELKASDEKTQGKLDKLNQSFHKLIGVMEGRRS